jgi:nicotinate-nucleotide adenylyltransferase
VPRLGILGGAFNPPHIGHLVGAQEALIQLELDKVVFVPVRQAPHREVEEDPGAEVRLELVELAIAGDERFTTSRIELDREGPSYTSETLREMRSTTPEDEHFLILGGDQAATLPTWHEPEEVLSLATVAVVERISWTRNAIGIKIARLKGSERVRYLDMPLIQVSSSAIRRRLGAGRAIRYLVPHAVGDYIETRGLYRPGAATTDSSPTPNAETASA